jgi:hypothetical protein
MQSAEIFQYTIFSQQEYSSAKCSVSRDIAKYLVSRDIPVHNIRLVGILQYTIFSQQKYSSAKCSVSRNIPVQNVQSVGIFQYKIFRT